MRVLITGITGFAGSHLCEYALSQGAEVFGSIRWRSKMENIEHVKEQLTLIECDLRDPSSVRALLDKAQPSAIFHLAAHSFVGTSFSAPVEAISNNVLCQVNLFESMRQICPNALVMVAGSSEEYGKVLDHEIPIKETNALRPLSPYAVSKVTQNLLGYQYHQSYGLHVVRTRAFNHTGPRRGEVFASSSFARQLAEIEAGVRSPIVHVGNLEAVRDFTDVRDTVRGYWLAVFRGEPGGVYNICSGNAWSIRGLLKLMLGGRDDIKVELDENRLRPSDVPILVGDGDKASSDLGWQPQIVIDQTLKDLLEYWRGRTNRRGGE